jgi:iron complex transport system substrate-binding protein
MTEKQINRTLTFGFLGVFAVLALLGFINRDMNSSFIEEELSEIHINEGYVSLAPSITEILFSLELDSQIVGVTKYCLFPKKAQAKKQVGGYLDPSLEAILSLRPKHVFLVEEAKSLISKLKKFEISTVALNHRSVEGILRSIQKVGDVTNRKAQAEVLVKGIKGRIETVVELSKNRPDSIKENVIVVIGKTVENGKIRSVTIAGNENFYGSLVGLAGAKMAYEGPISFPVLSREGLLVLNPDRVIDISTDLHKESNADSVAQVVWSEMNYLKAVENNKISILNERFNIIPGPRFILTLEGFSRVINTPK